MKISQLMSILLSGNQARQMKEAAVTPPLVIHFTFTRGLVTAASAAATAASAATAAATTVAASATATTATAAASASATAAATTATGAVFAGLGHVNGQSSAGVILAIQGSDRRLCLGLRGHLDESKAFGAAGVAVGDHFG